MIPVTKSFLPPLKEYEKYLEDIWSSGQLTNQGKLLQELEYNLKNYLDVKNLHFISNGTVALQLAINALDIYSGEIITTPFSFAATTTSILWQNCTPVFVDIEPNNFCIDVDKIESAITINTKAILAVHVYGYPCNVEKIAIIAKKYNLKVIYDGAHAFGCKYNGLSLLNYGDISTCSFHATKVFHTVEGGCCITKDKQINDKINLTKKFGFENDSFEYYGINAKNSELHSAMGLCNFKYILQIIKERKKISLLYDKLLNGYIQRPREVENFEYNYIYYPVIFKSETELLKVASALEDESIYIRRYFYPSLNKLSFIKNKTDCPISEDISTRIACLPLYVGLKKHEIEKICDIIKSNI